MRSLGIYLAVAVTFASAAGAVGCYFRADGLRTNAGWLLERTTAEGEAFASSLDGALLDRQLQTLEERHAVLERVHLWHRAQVLLVMLSVLSALGGHALFLLRRLHRDLVELERGGPVLLPVEEPRGSLAHR